MNKKRALHIFYFLVIFAFIFALLSFSNASSETAYRSILLCAKNVIPSLFPFFVISNLLINLKLHRPLSRPFKKALPSLFSLSENSSAALILGFISGYPLGAATCVELYKNGEISRREAERLLAFCNNAGPGFILGICGIGVFHSAKIGFVLIILHICSALLVGFSLRLISPIKCSKSGPSTQTAAPGFSFAFTDSIASAISSSLKISAYVIFFSQVTALIESADVFSCFGLSLGFSEFSNAIICGIFEITSGIYRIADIARPELAFVIISIFLGFGGFSVHFQALNFITAQNLSAREYFLGKVLHGIFSGVLAMLVTKIKLFNVSFVFSEFTKPDITNPPVIILPIVFICFFYIFFKKGWKNTSK